MSTLTGISTYAQAVAEYRATCSYSEDGDVTKARRFVTACRFLLSFPKRTQKQNAGEVEFDPLAIAQQMNAAERWILANASDNRHATYFDFQSFRR